MPEVIRRCRYGDVDLVEAANFPCILLVARPKTGDDTRVLVVVSDAEPAATIRGIGRCMLRDTERRCLSRFLSDRRR